MSLLAIGIFIPPSLSIDSLRMYFRIIVTTLFISCIHYSQGQTFQGPGGYIRDDGTINDYVLQIDNLSPDQLDEQFGLIRVCIDVTHTWISDLDIRLISPAGVNISLITASGGDTDVFHNTCFDMTSNLHIVRAWSPFTGAFLPFSSLGNVNQGSSGNGLWTLRILDTYPYADDGHVVSWSLTFGDNPALPDPAIESSLPIVDIHTDNITIPNEPEIRGTIFTYDNSTGALNKLADAPTYTGYVSIDVRGSSSQSFPKKSYRIELQDSLENDVDTSLLGLPAEEDWILYAPYTDKSLLRDALTYHLGNAFGGYAPRTKACEFYLNGDYQGIYFLEEKIKRDKNRVDIKKITPKDTVGDDLTGGYILKIDRDEGDGTYFVSKHQGTFNDSEIRVVFDDPDGPELQPVQKQYIEDYFDAFEDALYGDDFADPVKGYKRYVDMPSLIDFFLVSELGNNVDAYRLSTFFYKDKNSVDSLFHFGPLWDFNLAYGNADYCGGESVEGWAYINSGSCSNTPRWWERLLQDTTYQNQVRCRYDELRQHELSVGVLFAYLDSMTMLMGSGVDRNYDKWPILGMYVWPNAFIGQTYTQEMNYMKQWLMGRLEWLDAHLPGHCTPVTAVHDFASPEFTLDPNPADQFIRCTLPASTTEPYVLTLTGSNGTRYYQQRSVALIQEINVSSLPDGLYVLTLAGPGGGVHSTKVVIQH